jgi:3'-phosphoadenosine 5'-phosphosulfate sulfotransferase (PAPS reductase)/FAD synthetase
MSAIPLDLDALAMTDLEVASLTRTQRLSRLSELIAESWAILDFAVDLHILADRKELAGVVALFSGGNDSTVLTHLARPFCTHAAHANTGVGVEQTRQFVRDACIAWQLPLIERRAPRVDDSYRAIVLDQGFPGPGHHYKMFQRLKERALREIRNEIIDGRTRTHRVIFLAGRRRQESGRRANVPELERDGTTVWVSPLVNWTKADLNTYRQLYSVPRNEVSDLIHMSGECLCGSFAHEGEREEISMWFPQAFEEIAELEAILAGPGYEHMAEHKKIWGWGGNAETLRMSRVQPVKVGRLCSSCDARSATAAS